MNILIITYIHSYNYGAYLQAKATHLLIEKLGYKCKFLNYCNEGENKQRRLIKFYNNTNLVKNIKFNIATVYFGLIKKELINGKKNFYDSINELPKTKKYNTIEEIETFENIDLLICGSDQIWNPDICDGKLDEVYFGHITSAKKVISFASSFGSFKPNKEQKNHIKKYLNKFSFLSVRERYALDVIKEILPNKIVKEVIDPTLCLSKKDWLKNSLVNNKFDHIIRKPYVFIYSVSDYRKLQNIIKYVSENRNLKTVWVKNDSRKNLPVDFIVNNANPNDFVYLINKADYIITDSFHGTVFSINFEKDFTSIVNEKNPERVKNICKKLNLLDRVQYFNDISFNISPILYDSINEKLEIMRQDSIKWLLNAIEVSITNLEEKND